MVSFEQNHPVYTSNSTTQSILNTHYSGSLKGKLPLNLLLGLLCHVHIITSGWVFKTRGTHSTCPKFHFRAAVVVGCCWCLPPPPHSSRTVECDNTSKWLGKGPTNPTSKAIAIMGLLQLSVRCFINDLTFMFILELDCF